MNRIPRRHFFRLLGGIALAGAAPLTLTACQYLSPQPFETGREVPPPKGCEDLRSIDPEGDC